MKRNNSKEIFIQLLVGIIFLIFIGLLLNNLIINLYNTGLGFNFDWLFRPSGFALAESSLPYSPSDSYIWALFVAWINSIKVIISSLILATAIGVFVGISRTSSNTLIRTLSRAYVTLIRQIPLLLQLMFWYFVAFLGMKSSFVNPISNIISITNQGVFFLGLNLTPEYSSLLIGLSIFTGAYIAEVIRGGINSVPKGQWEAFRSLGISEIRGLLLVVFPQALPAILPGLTSQYLNLAKNSTLAIAVGYADIYAISDTIINQTGRAIEGFLLLMLSFLLLNIIIGNTMEFINSLFLAKNYRR